MTGEVIQHGKVPRRVEQPARLRVWPSISTSRLPIRPQQGETRGRVVDEGAAAPVGADDAAQQELAVAVEIVLGQQGLDRIGRRDGEDGGDAGPVAVTRHDSRGRARAERQPQRIQQDRLAGPGLPGEDRHACAEVDVEAVDQNVVADREAPKHLAASEHVAEDPADP